MADRSRTLIVAMAATYRWPFLAPFLLSLRQTGYAGDILLLVEDKWLHPEDRARFAEVRAETASIYPLLSRVPHAWRQWRFNTRYAVVERLLRAAAARLPVSQTACQRASHRVGTWFQPIAHARFFFYHLLLRDRWPRYDHIIHCDVRDVYFQSAPDEWRSDAPLNFFLESFPSIAAEPLNARWIAQLFGTAELDRVGGFAPSCSGVMHGTARGMMDYFEAMSACLLPRAAAIAGQNIDQGAHNYLLRTGRFPGARIWRNGEGLALNMQGATSSDYQMGTDGVIRTPGGTTIPVIHQYDRFPDVCAVVREHFGHSATR